MVNALHHNKKPLIRTSFCIGIMYRLSAEELWEAVEAIFPRLKISLNQVFHAFREMEFSFL